MAGGEQSNRGIAPAGRLAYGCTDLSLAWPHGGTRLPLVADVFVYPPSEWEVLDQEETNSAAAVVWLGGDVVVSFTFADWDNTALAFLVPNTGTAGGHTVAEWPGTDVPAGCPTTTYTNVVFTPFDPSQPGFVLYKAAPVPKLNLELMLSVLEGRETMQPFAEQRAAVVPGVLIGLPDASDRVGKMAKFSALVAGGL